MHKYLLAHPAVGPQLNLCSLLFLWCGRICARWCGCSVNESTVCPLLLHVVLWPNLCTVVVMLWLNLCHRCCCVVVEFWPSPCCCAVAEPVLPGADVVNFGKFIRSCLEWEHTGRSIIGILQHPTFFIHRICKSQKLDHFAAKPVSMLNVNVK
jgi:hypothetical protein